MKQGKGNLMFIAIILVVIIVGVSYDKGYFKLQKSNSTVDSLNEGKKVEPTSDILKISQLSPDMKGKKVKIKAEIINKKDSKDGHTFLIVNDETGQIGIPIFADKHIDNQKLALEKFYIFSGVVDIFNNAIEIIPQSQNDIIEEQTQQLEINKDNIGEIVTIEGAVITKYMHPDGHTFLNIKITDNGVDVEVPLFKTLNYNADNLTIQSIITVKGKITEYKGKLEVIPEKTEDINIISKGDESKVKFKNIKDITNNDRGMMITSHAYVTNVKTINGHTYFTLTDVNDKNSRIDAVLFSAETKELSARKTVIDNASKGQFQVWVLAMVDIYDSKLELIIDKADIN